MGRLYSLDLRERVVNAAAATSRRQAAARFGVAVTTLIRWMAALTATGTWPLGRKDKLAVGSSTRTRRSCAP